MVNAWGIDIIAEILNVDVEMAYYSRYLKGYGSKGGYNMNEKSISW